MKGNITLALVAAVFLAACQSEPPKFDAGGIKIGDTRASLLQAFPTARCSRGARPDAEECVGKGPAIEGVPFGFYHVDLFAGQVERIAALSEQAPREGALLKVIKAKYGEPDKNTSDKKEDSLYWRWQNGEELQYEADEKQVFVFLTGATYRAAIEANPRLKMSRPDIKGVTLGETYAAIIAEHPSLTCKVIEPKKRECTQGDITYGSSKGAAISLFFYEDSLKAIGVDHLDRDDNAMLLRALAKKFGPPDDPSPSDPTRTNWEMPYNQIITARNPADGEHPSVTLLDMDYFGADLRERTEKAAQAL